MSTPNPPRDDPGQPQHGPQSQCYSYANLTTPIPPAYPVYPTYPYPYPAPPPKTNWWAVGLTPDGGHLTGGTAGPAGRMSVCRASVEVHPGVSGAGCPPGDRDRSSGGSC